MATAQASKPIQIKTSLLRLPESMNAQARIAAIREGISLEKWLRKAVQAHLDQVSQHDTVRDKQ